MAKIGLKYPVCAKLGSTGTYSDGTVIAKAIKSDISIETNDVKLFADDEIAEFDTSFKQGKISLEVDDLSDTVYTMLLGHSKSTTTEEITCSDIDDAPYVGVGFYGRKVKDGVSSYRAVWFPKVKFAEPSDSNSTKGETVAFSTQTIEGTIIATDGKWKYEQTFVTEAEAKEYLEGKASITTQQ